MSNIRQGRHFPSFLSPQSRATQGREPRQLSPSAPELDSNTKAGVVSPSLRNSPWRSPGHDSNEDKKATKRLHFKSKKKHQELLWPRPGTQFKAAVEVVQWLTLCSPPLDARGRSFQPQEHREGSQGPLRSGFPWQLCSPAPQPDPS